MVASSSKELEYVSLALCVHGVIWLDKISKILREVLGEATVKTLFDVSVGEVSHACIADAKIATLSDYTKHVELNIDFW